MIELRGRAGGDTGKYYILGVNIPSTWWSTLRDIPRRDATPRAVPH